MEMANMFSAKNENSNKTEWDKIFKESDGNFVVERNKNYGLIDKEGIVLIAPQ